MPFNGRKVANRSGACGSRPDAQPASLNYSAASSTTFPTFPNVGERKTASATAAKPERWNGHFGNGKCLERKQLDPLANRRVPDCSSPKKDLPEGLEISLGVSGKKKTLKPMEEKRRGSQKSAKAKPSNCAAPSNDPTLVIKCGKGKHIL